MISPRALQCFIAVSLALTVCACARAASVGWAWTGGVTPVSAVITARIESAGPVSLRINETDTSFPTMIAEPMRVGTLHRFNLAGLKPDTEYGYRFVAADGRPVDEEKRSFRTFPAHGTPFSFRFAVSSCAKSANSPVFTAATAQDVRFFLHTGDFHYANIGENRVEVFRKAYDYHLSSPRLRAFLATTPLFYQWDDHDFGPNDSNRNSPSSEASLRNYRELVPHYPFLAAAKGQAGPADPTDQVFRVGRVCFILSDLRSQRDPEGRRMMNAAQDAWLKAQLLAAKNAGCPLIFWVTSVPWNGAPANADRWQGYSAHRAEIADFIKKNGLAERVAILSGDAHMTAIDDGSNSDFATGRGAPIRVFQAGPIANQGSYKGGPYSHGARFGGGLKAPLNQFGLVDIHDDGKRVRVVWSGREGSDEKGDQVLVADRDGAAPIRFEFTVP